MSLIKDLFHWTRLVRGLFVVAWIYGTILLNRAEIVTGWSAVALFVLAPVFAYLLDNYLLSNYREKTSQFYTK